MQTTEPSTRRGLVRRPTGRLIAGVAGGLADATGTRAAWWRLGFGLLALVGGLGVALYVILWVVLPRADLPRSTAQRIADRFPDMPGWAGVGLLGFGVLLLVGHLWPTEVFRPVLVPPFAREIRDASPGFALAVMLIGLGILLFRGSGEREPETLEPEATGEIGGDAPPPPPWQPRPARRRRERSVTGWLSLGLALAAAGVAWLLLASGTMHLSLGQVLALPLAVLGAGLLVGTVFGRARWTVLFGLPLIPLVLFASIMPTPITGRYEERRLTIRNAAQAQSSYQQSGGTLTFDFRRLRPGEHPGPIHATLGIGSIEVFLLEGMAVDVRGTVGMGGLRLHNRDVYGLGVSDELHLLGPSPIQMTLELGFGEVDVFVMQVPRKPAQHAIEGGNA